MLLLSILFLNLFFINHVQAQEGQTSIKILIAGISNFKDYNEVKKILFKTEGLQLSYDSSAQKLQTFKGSYQGNIQSLLDTLNTDLPPTVMTKNKTLPSQVEEITILPK